MTLRIENDVYVIEKTGYGNWDITKNGIETIHTTDSWMIDAIDDEDNEHYNEERECLVNMFS